jgi:hypothetical protein
MAVLGLISGGWAASVIFEDKFTTLDPAWGAPSNTLAVKDGQLVISPGADETYTYVYQGNIFPNDMELNVTVTFIRADGPTWGSGPVFWGKDTKEYYAVLLNARGWYGVQRRMGDRFLLPVSWRPHDAIKKGAGVENQVKVVTKGNRATIYFNGEEAVSLNGMPPKGGSLIGLKCASGVGADETNEAAFTNLKIMQP